LCHCCRCRFCFCCCHCCSVFVVISVITVSLFSVIPVTLAHSVFTVSLSVLLSSWIFVSLLPLPFLFRGKRCLSRLISRTPLKMDSCRLAMYG
jgi:hypothetical protein